MDESLQVSRVQNAAASFDIIAAMGLPANPLDFPEPQFGIAARVNASVHNPATNEDVIVPNVIYEIRPDGTPPSRAYWIGRKLKKAIYGCVRSCTVLRLREGGWAGPHGNSQWEITAEMAAVKIIDLNIVESTRGQHVEDPLKEVAATQYMCREGALPNILPCWDLFRDEKYIYMFMPFCSSGELFGYVERNGRFQEPIAKFWFQQLLNVSFFLFLMTTLRRIYNFA